MIAVVWSLTLGAATAQELWGRIRAIVRSEGGPVAAATVRVGTNTVATDAEGVADLAAPAGPVVVTATREGFFDARADAQVTAGEVTTVEIELAAHPDVDEEVIVVASTRTGRRVEDQPTRVEVIGREDGCS